MQKTEIEEPHALAMLSPYPSPLFVIRVDMGLNHTLAWKTACDSALVTFYRAAHASSVQLVSIRTSPPLSPLSTILILGGPFCFNFFREVLRLYRDEISMIRLSRTYQLSLQSPRSFTSPRHNALRGMQRDNVSKP